MKHAKISRTTMMDRLTVTLGNDQREKVAAIARKSRTSAATIIRQAIDKYVANYPLNA